MVHYRVNPEIQNMYGIHCVYFLFKAKRLVYIGSTKDLQNRISQHKSNWYRAYSEFRFIVCNAGDHKKYESRWIHKFTPKYNSQRNIAHAKRIV